MALENTLKAGVTKLKTPFARKQQAVQQQVQQNADHVLQPNMVAQAPKDYIRLDVADLSTMIDIVTESQAVEAFDQEMASKYTGTFGKMTGFFKRSFQRMGRDAWIQAKKSSLKKMIESDLQNGICSEASITSNYQEATRAIEEKAYLAHEQTQNETDVSPHIQKLLDDWVLATPKDRKMILPKLKQALDGEYKITSEMSQIEQAMIKFEQAQLDGTLKTLNAKLNVFDIGRYEKGYGKRTESLLVKILDGCNGYISRTTAPDWMKQKVGGMLQHPNTYAILSALGTRAGVSAFVGGVSLGVGGLLIPVATGAVVGGVLAAGRARREMRDRTAQIDRRGATGFVTGDPSVDGASSNESHNTANYQHKVADFYARVSFAAHCDPLSPSYYSHKRIALDAGLNYLLKHKIGRDHKLNLLSYEGATSVSKQHVDMIVLLNKLFPGLVADFNSGRLFQAGNPDTAARDAQRLSGEIERYCVDMMNKRISEEKAYARKQGLIYAGAAVTLGSAGGYALHELGFGGSSGGHTIEHPTSSTVVTHYPDNLEPYTNVKRDFWYDNGTPKPKFDHTELMIHQKGQNWNVHRMLGKTPWTHGHHIDGIQGSDFSSQKLQAVLTPRNGGPSFVLPIDANGNIQIPDALQADFDARRFAFLEVGQVHVAGGTIHLTPIATVEGEDTMVLQPITTEIPGVPKQEFIPGTDNWYGVPFGGNRYHELKKPQALHDEEPMVLDVNPNNQPKNPPAPGANHVIPQQRQVIANQLEDILAPKAPQGDIFGQDPQEPEPQKPQNAITKEPKVQEGIVPPEARFDRAGWEDENEKLNPTVVGLARRALQNTKEKIEKLETRIAKKAKYQKKVHKDLEIKMQVLQKKMEKQEKALNEKVKKLYKKETPEQQKGYQNSIRDLVDTGVIVTDDHGKILTFHCDGRSIIAIRSPNGQIIPFYRSYNGTSGKTKGKWFPFFGISPSGWFVKGGREMDDAYHSSVFKTLSDQINGAFTWEHEWDLDYPSTKTFHPLSVFGEANSVKWIEKESQSQVSLQTWDGQGLFSNYWISEWIARLHAPKNMTLAVDSYGLYPQFLGLIEGQVPLNDTELQGTQRQKACEFMFQKLLLSHDGSKHQPMLKKIVSEKIPVHIGDFPTSGQNGLCLNLTDQERGTDDFWSLSKHLNQAMSEYSLLQFRAKSQDHEERFHQLEQRFPDPSLAFGILSKGYTSQRAYNSSQGMLRSSGLSPDLIQDCIDLYQDVSTETFSSYETGIFF